MKKYISAFLALAVVLTLFTACHKEGSYVENTCPYALMVQDTMYYYTGEEIDEKIKIREEDILGHVTSVIPESSMPSVDGQANIDILGAPYLMYDGNLIVRIDGEWIIFETREKEEKSEETEFVKSGSEKLTLERVIELSEKGEELTWSDFAQYESIETGSGLYILLYEIDDNFDLWIGGVPTDTPMYIRLAMRSNPDTYIDIRTDNVAEFIENVTALKEPPTLKVICNEESIDALRGGYSWIIKNADGTETATIADSVHPLETKEIIPHISIVPTIYSHIDPLLVRFGWSQAPYSVSVRAWSETCFGKPESAYEEIEVSVIQLDYVGSKPNYSIRLKDGNYVYEVIAKWDSEGYSGSVNYSFFAEIGGLCDGLCGYPLAEEFKSE